ncbi:MAG: biopolymer transporter ExbD [Calditrichaeota bacterium]|nr:biopolymer transporter ExbD [Calditrichota bacterium]MCB0268387.1 biopolymer transporter ExbD [Calditrichota bacterium]MCB0299777.1 biopolymer transporter ExbD [Calditrichota bacterium]
MQITKQKPSIEIPSASMADIAFLLLIFFMVCTTIFNERGLQLVLPEWHSEVTPVHPDNLAVVLLNDAGAILLDNQPVQIYNVERQLRKRLLSNPNLVISLQTTRFAKYEDYIEIIDQIKRAGATRISIANPLSD